MAASKVWWTASTMARGERDSSERAPLIPDGSINAEEAEITPAKTIPIAVIAVMLLIVQAGFGGYGIMLRKFCGDVHANALVVSFYRDALAFPVLLIAAGCLEVGAQSPFWPRSNIWTIQST